MIYDALLIDELSLRSYMPYKVLSELFKVNPLCGICFEAKNEPMLVCICSQFFIINQSDANKYYDTLYSGCRLPRNYKFSLCVLSVLYCSRSR